MSTGDTSGQSRPWWRSGWVIGFTAVAALLAVSGFMQALEETFGDDTTLEEASSPSPDPPSPTPATPTPTPSPSPEPEPEPERTPFDASIEAAVGAGPAGLRFVPELDLVDCRFDLNPGLIRSGYTSRVSEVAAREELVIPWSQLTSRDGERFDYARYRPEMLSVRCEDRDGQTRIDTWSW